MLLRRKPYLAIFFFVICLIQSIKLKKFLSHLLVPNTIQGIRSRHRMLGFNLFQVIEETWMWSGTSSGCFVPLRLLASGKKLPKFLSMLPVFSVAEVLLALEYLHMLGIIYRDLEQEHVLVGEDWHILLSDFDFSFGSICCVPRMIWLHASLSSKRQKEKNTKAYYQVSHFPELSAEPTNAGSLSFVATHEYLAPKISNCQKHDSISYYILILIPFSYFYFSVQPNTFLIYANDCFFLFQIYFVFRLTYP